MYSLQSYQNNILLKTSTTNLQNHPNTENTCKSDWSRLNLDTSNATATRITKSTIFANKDQGQDVLH